MILERQASTNRPAAHHQLSLSLSALLGGAGVLHFVIPRFYDQMIPKWLPPSARSWTYGSGVAELAVAAAVAAPRTRRRAAQFAAMLFVVVFPGNIQMAIDAQRGKSTVMRVGTILRLPLQGPLIWWAWRVAKRS